MIKSRLRGKESTHSHKQSSWIQTQTLISNYWHLLPQQSRAVAPVSYICENVARKQQKGWLWQVSSVAGEAQNYRMGY